jgi:hypothetical protein
MLLILSLHVSNYISLLLSDDIYGQIAADLDDISYERERNDFIVVQKEATPAPQQAAKSGFREYWHERKEVG